MEKEKTEDNHYHRIVLSQTNPESREILKKVLNSKLGSYRRVIEYLLYYTDKPEKQKKVLEYSSNFDILDEEYFMISMVGLNDRELEDKLFDCFNKKLIRNVSDFIRYKNEYQVHSNEKRLIKV